MTERSRYREEAGVACIDVTVASMERLFDRRDPAPFRERDLDEDLAEYLRGSAEDLAASPELRVVFWLETPGDAAVIREAYRAHLEYELERLARASRRRYRTGLTAMALATVLIVLLLSTAKLLTDRIGGSLGEAVHELIVIGCWVLLWRPIDTLAYEWIPVRRERNVLRRLSSAELEVRTGRGPQPARR